MSDDNRDPIERLEGLPFLGSPDDIRSMLEDMQKQKEHVDNFKYHPRYLKFADMPVNYIVLSEEEYRAIYQYIISLELTSGIVKIDEPSDDTDSAR